MPRLLDHHVLLVTGKGGVGKSTVAVTVARAAAQTGKRVLLVEFESVSRAAPLFGLEAIGTTPVQVAHGLSIRGFDTMDSLRFFALQQLKIERLVRVVMRNKTVAGFFQAMPAIKSVTFLYHLWRLVAEHGPDGDGKWDLVVCDLPTTGFILGLYGVPTMVQQIFHIGPLARIARGMGDFLYDSERVGLVMVTLPEEMPVVETIEFVDALREKHGVRAAATIVNAVVSEPLQPGIGEKIRAQLEVTPTESGRSPDHTERLRGMLRSATILSGRAQRAARLIPDLTPNLVGVRHALPHLFRRDVTLSSIDILATALLASIRAQAAGPSPS